MTTLINDKRKLHNSPPLAYDPSISVISQRWAEDMASSGSVRHRTSFLSGETPPHTASPSSASIPYGENIHVRFGSETLTMSNIDLIRGAIDSWYNEIQNYDFNNPSLTPPPSEPSKKVGHFTCLVWKSSRLYGMGIARSGDKVYVVMNTFPKQINDRATIEANIQRPTR